MPRKCTLLFMEMHCSYLLSVITTGIARQKDIIDVESLLFMNVNYIQFITYCFFCVIYFRSILTEVTTELKERAHRWGQIEMLCNFSVVSNPGFTVLAGALGLQNIIEQG